jgi:hypothetical protein
MDAVSDIFAFAARHADYWTEFLSGGDYSDVLSPEEVRALEAARLHIGDLMYDVLLQCGEKLASRLQAQGVVSKAFQPDATKRNRLVRIAPPKPWTDRLYGFQFGFGPDEKKEAILLYGSLVVKKGAMERLKGNLAKNGVKFEVDDYYVYSPGLSLTDGAKVADLAEQASRDLAGLFAACA